MDVWVCDRCGGADLPALPCACAAPFDPVEVRRRHRDAVRRARTTDRRGAEEARRARRPAA